MKINLHYELIIFKCMQIQLTDLNVRIMIDTFTLCTNIDTTLLYKNTLMFRYENIGNQTKACLD